jgi:hypothetical protein
LADLNPKKRLSSREWRPVEARPPAVPRLILADLDHDVAIGELGQVGQKMLGF